MTVCTQCVCVCGLGAHGALGRKGVVLRTSGCVPVTCAWASVHLYVCVLTRACSGGIRDEGQCIFEQSSTEVCAAGWLNCDRYTHAVATSAIDQDSRLRDPADLAKQTGTNKQ